MKPIHSSVKTVSGSLALAVALCGTTAVPGFCAPDYKKIIGDWKSNFGPVHVKLVAPEEPKGSASVIGNWQETPKHEGKIESGHYNAATGELNLAYVETWNKNHGKAKLMVDKSGKKASGNWKGEDGTAGTWTWER